MDRRGEVIDTKYRLVSQSSAPESIGRDRPAYAFESQGRWPFAWPGLQHMQQWRPRFGFRPRHHWRPHP